ncbi:MAG TPA: NRDE family protein [Woeseiaceae bacterium]|nr:NRDE family protein [Woeseiaceae bacterium]
MCLVAFALKAHPDYRLVLAANRDEFHNRPAEPLHWWPDRPDVLAGRDLKAGGTWLGVSRTGRFATVTNYREDLQREHRGRSRGEVVTGFLTSTSNPLQYCNNLEPGNFAGFSLLAIAGEAAAYVSNRGDEARELAPGVYGLSNASLDTPWSKVVRSKAALQSLLREHKERELEPGPLFEMLSDAEPAPGDDYAGTGLSPGLARAVSAPFISTADYGTRCSTVVLVSSSGAVEIYERRFDRFGALEGESRFSFAS